MALRSFSRAAKQALLPRNRTFSHAAGSFLSSPTSRHQLCPQLFHADSFFSASVTAQQQLAESLPELQFPSQHHGNCCSPIDLVTFWRVSTGSSYLPSSSELDEVFLPTQLEDTVSPMLMNTKRTFNPSTIVRKRRHGFLARKATVGGRRVLARRFAKGRRRLSA